MENAKVTRLQTVAAHVAPRPLRAVANRTIAPRPITDEIVG